MWITYIAPHLDVKKMAKRKESLLPLKGEQVKIGVSEEQKKIFLLEYAKWVEKKN